jgi:hypothetical protein
LYRFCFLLCRRDPSFATKEPDAPKNLNNTPTTEDSRGLQTDRQRRERERERARKRKTLIIMLGFVQARESINKHRLLSALERNSKLML